MQTECQHGDTCTFDHTLYADMNTADKAIFMEWITSCDGARLMAAANARPAANTGRNTNTRPTNPSVSNPRASTRSRSGSHGDASRTQTG